MIEISANTSARRLVKEFADKTSARRYRFRPFVMSVLAWIALICAWDLAARMDDKIESAAATQPMQVASILGRLSNPWEIDYEAMHESGGCRRERCIVGERVLDR
jgi:hypothetical protein